ncbi:MAG: hypothetical protein IT428_06990 [Planctomycetaceae bacterium]|nr:hypothetical protein [Planctomycetaceae bacterium]
MHVELSLNDPVAIAFALAGIVSLAVIFGRWLRFRKDGDAVEIETSPTNKAQRLATKKPPRLNRSTAGTAPVESIEQKS